MVGTARKRSDEVLHIENLLNVYQSPKRLTIRKLLNIHQELSLTQLAELMSMSKTAVHHHLKLMRDAGIVRTVREEEVRGSLHKKYFGLTKVPRRFFVEELDNISAPKDRYLVMRQMLKTLQLVYREVQYNLNLMLEFTEDLDESLAILNPENVEEHELKSYQEQLLNHNTHLRNFYLTKTQFQAYKALEDEFMQKVENLPMDADEASFPYLVSLLDFPLLNLINFQVNSSQ